MGNREIVARSLAAVWHPCTQMKMHEATPLVPIARAQGPWLYDYDGRRILDGVSSWWVNLFGHSHAYINAAIARQVESLEHVMLAGFTHEPVVQLSERLAAIAPGRLGHAFYGSDGASATEIALKMAFHYWSNLGRRGKDRFVALEGGYHGETVGALGVTDVPIFRDAYAPLLRSGITAPFADADGLEKILEAHHGEIAALIVEPLVQGAAGMRMYSPEYLKRARAACTRYEVLLIADEIMTGFGRTGTMFACEQAGIAPDLLCLSKGLTGGYLPLSCVLSTDAIYGAFYDDRVARGFLHSHSYTGNALACRAACAVLELFERDAVIAANAIKAERFTAAAATLAKHPNVRDFRHRGMIWAFEVAGAGPRFATEAFALALERGVLLRPIGSTVYFMPPYVVGDEEFDLLVNAGIAIADALGGKA
jgi:adenosylmethionine-8-amino-7-oxononanoate aminotransferase